MDWSRDRIGNNSKKPTLFDKVEGLKLEDGEDFTLIRMIGPSKRVAHHMMPVFKQDGTPVMNKWKQQTRIPKVCLAYNSKTGKFPEDSAKKCPYCKIDPDAPKVEVHSNAIVRTLQEDFNAKKRNKQRSKKETKKRELFDGTSWYIAESKASKNLTPVRFFRITSSIGNKISDFTSLNKVKNKKTGETKVYAPQHQKYGFDLNIKFDNSKSASEKYSIVKDDRTELTEEEMNYLLWDIDIDAPESFEEALKEAKSFKKRMDAAEMVESKGKKKRKNDDDDDDDDWNEDSDDDNDDDDEDEDDEDNSKKKKSKKDKSSKNKKKKKDDDDSDDDDDSEDWEDDEDEDEDDSEDDDSDDDNDDEDEDDEDDEPVKKKGKDKGKKNKKGKNKKKKKDDDDDDDDWDSDDDDEDADEDSDDDDDADEDDEDDKKSKKKSKKDKSSKKNKKSSKKSKKDDDDDDEDDDDSDDDSDDWDDDD